MLLNLAVNHGVVTEESKDRKKKEEKTEESPTKLLDQDQRESGWLSYNASSPDELALVNGARFLGVTFLGKDSDTNVITV